MITLVSAVSTNSTHVRPMSAKMAPLARTTASATRAFVHPVSLARIAKKTSSIVRRHRALQAPLASIYQQDSIASVRSI